MTTTYRNRQKGVALLIALVMLMLITAVAFGLILMSRTDTSINSNFKGEETEYFAARAGAEEARNRLLPGAVDQSGNSIAFTNLPTAPPDGGGKVLYILNCKTQNATNNGCSTMISLADITTPPSAGSPNPYFDDELCHDVPGGANGIVATPFNVRCTTMFPMTAIVISTIRDTCCPASCSKCCASAARNWAAASPA